MVQVLIIGRDAEGWKRSLDTWTGLEVQAVSLPSAGIRTFEKTSPDIVIVAEPPGSTKAEPMLEAIRERPLGQLVPLIWVAPADAGGEDVASTSRVAPDVSPARLVEELERHLEVQLGREPGSTAGGLAGESTAATTNPSQSIDDVPGGASGSVEVNREASRANQSPSADARDSRAETRRGESADREPVEGRDYVVEPIDEKPPDGEPSASDVSADRSVEEAPSQGSRDPVEDATSGRFGGESTVFPTSSPGEQQPQSSIEATDIERKTEEVRHQDYFAILEVERTADTEDVERAYEQMRRAYHPDAVDGRLAQSYADDLRDIGDALTDAYAVLADDDLREAYLDATTRK